MIIKKEDDLDAIPNGLLHTDELQDIIAVPPTWLIRQGIGMLFCVILLVLSTTFVIRYPDIVRCKLIINTESDLPNVKAETSGQLSRILIKSGQSVKQGQLLGYLESDADPIQVLSLYDKLLIIKNALNREASFSRSLLSNVEIEKLGEIKSVYESFYLSYLTSRVFIDNKKWEKISAFTDNLSKLNDFVELWKKKYILIAPETGVIRYNEPLKFHQKVMEGQELFYFSNDDNGCFGKTQITQRLIGKIAVGQKVIVMIDHFPFEKFGVINGVVASISEFPSDTGTYSLTINFQGFDKKLVNLRDLRPGMVGNAEITTMNITLFSRLVNNLFKKTAMPFKTL